MFFIVETLKNEIERQIEIEIKIIKKYRKPTLEKY